jgi:hypothetical protein
VVVEEPKRRRRRQDAVHCKLAEATIETYKSEEDYVGVGED